jgi:transcriptional regulator with XRE-family HTH domain
MNGSELRYMREERGLSQLELSGMTGVGRTYISLYENDRMIPAREHLEMLGEVLPGVMLDDSAPAAWYPEIDNETISALRARVKARLTEAPEGFLFGFDEEARKAIEWDVLVDVLRLVVIHDVESGQEPLIPVKNEKGSVGESLRAQLGDISGVASSQG